MKTVRWGIIGPGNIAHKFADALRTIESAILTAVASRDKSRARRFADQYAVPLAFDSYAALAACPELDAVYIATPHSHHAKPTTDCLKHGKAVLCEKPITVNAAELQYLIDLAHQNNTFLMEAMWTRFLPIMETVKDWIDTGAIGEPRLVQADFGFRSDKKNPKTRLFNPALAGGSLLDVGVYPISFSHWVFGDAPVAVSGQAMLGDTGVDEQMCATMKFTGGRLASVISAIRTKTNGMATIFGTDGQIRIAPPFWQATTATLIRGKNQQTIERPFQVNGFEYEIMEVCRCLNAGLAESPKLTLQDSLGVMQTLDMLRAQWKLHYPSELKK
jgi:dihydrodiol dehydrogenase / D-xylose 1-dehydrogenase (NADP)